MNFTRSLAAGVLAGAAGTAAMDYLLYRRYRNGGGKDSFWPWESAAGVMSWDSGEALKSADRLRARDALERGNEFLLDWAKRQTRPAGYSIEDVYAAGAMRVMIPCLRFTAEFGKRGYDVVDSPLIMRRGPKGYRLEPAAN